MSTEKHYLIEEKEEGKYAVRARGSWRANKVLDSKEAAEYLAKSLNPNDQPELSLPRSNETAGTSKTGASK
ncbi:MAG: hypothetical protein JST28_16235 [Acidobacteria bacterium]|nr:hypothetical protein [Acidobacteriota bacterium]